MPFGLHLALAIFQRLLDEILGLELEPVLVYLDDIRQPNIRRVSSAPGGDLSTPAETLGYD